MQMAKTEGTKQHELRRIPNVGVQTQRDLIAMGYTTIDSLKGKRAEELYAEECRLRGCAIGAGCRKIRGKAFWLPYTGDDVCPIYQCCRDKKKQNCGGCPELPCAHFMKDPIISDEENEANLRRMLERLKAWKE